jgi:hypothetical protein
LLLAEVIRQINTKKVQNDCRAKNVIIGASMGGQVARWALKTMENAGENHDSHTYISFDSPQKGAHIPLSIQAAAYWASRSGINTGSPSLWQKLNLPAARQLIFDNLGSAERSARITVGQWEVSGLTGFGDIQFTGTDFKCLRDQYVGEMIGLDYPKQTRNVAIACGALSGSPQGYVNGSALFNMNVPIPSNFGVFIAGFNGNAAHFKIWSGNGSPTSLSVTKAFKCTGSPVPSAGVGMGGRAGQQFIFAAALPTSFNKESPCQYSTLYVNALQNTAYLDNAPGSYRQDLVGLKQLIEDEAAAIEGAVVNLNNLPSEATKKQCFIPLLSAFDIQQSISDQSLYQDFRIISPTSYPFAEIFAPKVSLKHVEIDNDIIDFLIKQIKLREINLPTILINRSYNFANVNKAILSSVDIGTAAIVRINGAGKAGFDDEANSALASGFEVVTGGNCGPAVVNVNSGGTLKIGEATRIGTLRITNGSVVRVFSGGTLTIDPNSQLIVESGGKFIIDAGAIINLVGSESTILVKSNGELALNAGLLKVSGDGFVQFDAGHKLTLPATGLSLSGTSKTTRIIRLNASPQNTFNKIVVKGAFSTINALIEYGNNRGAVIFRVLSL